MRKPICWIGSICILGAVLWGCGSNPSDIGNDLIIVSVAPSGSDGGAGFTYGGNEVIAADADVGCDGLKADPAAAVPIFPDADGSEGNSFNDGFAPYGIPGCAEVGGYFTDSVVDITVRNEARPGVKDGVGRPLEITSIRFTYSYPDGTPAAYAPPRLEPWQQEVMPGEAVSVSVVIDTLDMKAGDPVTLIDGVRDLLYTGQGNGASGYTENLNATITLGVEDSWNGNSFSVSASVPLHFIILTNK